MVTAHVHPLFNALTAGSSFRQYRLLEQIGVGGEGVVWSALDQDRGEVQAIKFRDVPEAAEADMLGDKSQLEKLIKLRQAHILPILEYGFEAQMRFTVSPYLPGGTLFQKLKTGPMHAVAIVRYANQIASALDYLHSQGIVHRDLKTQNILLDLRDNSYLADFGLARIVTTSTLAFHTGHGTPPYASPEQIQSRPMTHKSDLYSFGILLYEMFTGQLPWNGKKQLGMEQLTSDQELPDPREFNENLPFVLADILRRITAADPNARPPSAREIMRVLHRIFNIPESPLLLGQSLDGWVARDEDVEQMLKTAFVQWKATDGTYNLGLTKFALIDLKHAAFDTGMYNEFLLAQALTYAYNDDHWWQAVRDPRERLAVSSRLLKKQNEVMAGRIVTHLTGDANIGSLPEGLTQNLTTGLLETGVKTDNAFLRREIFDGLRLLTHPKGSWNAPVTIRPEQAQRLGTFALEDSEFGDTVAKLIGHLQSTSAVRVLLKSPDEARKITALLLIQKAAGSLPAFVPGDLRFRLSMEWVLQRLLQDPVNLISAYMLVFLGAALGVSLQVYVTYNLPKYMDFTRITVALEQGLIIGAIFALGPFSIRIAMERFQSAPALPRLLIGTVMGTLGMNFALLIFHVLFLTTSPHGFLISAACLWMAVVFALSGLSRLRILRMLLASIAAFAAILGTWWLHTNYAVDPTALTPIFYYDSTWTFAQVALTALGVALPIGITGQLVRLSIVEE